MREKYDGLKKLLVIVTLMITVIGFIPAEVSTQNVPGTTINAGPETAQNNVSSVEDSESVDKEETWDKEEASEEKEEPKSEESESEEPKSEEPEEEEPKLPAYTVTDMTAFKYAQTNCNVRSGPSTDYEVIGHIVLNQGVNIVGRADTGWYKIDYSGMDAFVSDSLLADTQVAIETPEPEPQPEPQHEPQPEPQPEPQQKERWEYSEAELIQICLVEAGVHDGMSDWDKAVAINNYLCGIGTYDDSLTHRSTFDMLAYGIGVCQGYANAYKKLMEAAGVSTDFIGGQGWTGTHWGSHGWNRVLIDGNYYYVDVTWNDCLGYNKYLLISYEEMSKDHYEESINPYRIE